MDLKFKGKTAMVAASSRGLGYGIAKALAKEGANVAVASSNEERIKRAAHTLRTQTGSEVEGYVFDVFDAASITKWVSDVKERFGTIDSLVVNAAGPPAGNFEDFDDSQWQNAFELTLLSTVRMIRAVLPEMKKQKKGSIIVITSTSVKEPIDTLLLSTVMRSGVSGLIKYLSRELSSFGIRINNLVPGRYDTERVRELDRGNARRANGTAEEQRKIMESRIPLGRYGKTEEFGNAAAFLLSDLASYISGEMFIVDGGLTRSV
ncbi:SDR family oxidoreductase [Chitinispirillales bacterium ANBcel5]|uniref:SDR family oxidoreductase n=1 Tax=Cellulosispirillum alkaliphilum TaxID=3039283 RepID=UPI002A524327|nr:SDR family oxidoreductase [Chitinispirillales bacterium ANBcel5]